MTRMRQQLRGTLASVSLAAWLLAATGLAGLAGPGPAVAYEALNTAVHELARDLARDLASKQLKRRPVLVTPDDFFEQGEGLRLPLSETLSEAFRDELSGYGVTTVLIPGDNAEILDIKGKWIGSCEHGLLLSVAINQRTDSGGVKRVATARQRVRQVNPELCRRDIDFLGRDVVRQLERGLRDKRTVYVRPVAVAGEVPQPERLGAYLASWLNAALAQGRTHRRLTALHPAGELDPLSAKEIANRSLAPRRSGSGNAPSSLVGDMVRAKSEIRGSVDVFPEYVRVVLNLVDSRSQGLTNARVELDKSMFPPDMWKSVSRCYEPTLPANPDVGLELGTTHGESRVTYRDGELIRFSVRAARPSHVYLFDVNSECQVTVLHPRPDFSGSDLPDPPLAADKPRLLPEGYEIEVLPPYGMDVVVAVASVDRVDLPPDWLQPGVTAVDLKRWLRGLTERGTRDLAEAQVTVLTEP